MGDRQNGENLLPRGYPRRRAVRHGGANPSTKWLSPPTCRQARRRCFLHDGAFFPIGALIVSSIDRNLFRYSFIAIRVLVFVGSRGFYVVF